jgi:hypothetical protein
MSFFKHIQDLSYLEQLFSVLLSLFFLLLDPLSYNVLISVALSYYELLGGCFLIEIKHFNKNNVGYFYSKFLINIEIKEANKIYRIDFVLKF